MTRISPAPPFGLPELLICSLHRDVVIEIGALLAKLLLKRLRRLGRRTLFGRRRRRRRVLPARVDVVLDLVAIPTLISLDHQPHPPPSVDAVFALEPTRLARNQ